MGISDKETEVVTVRQRLVIKATILEIEATIAIFSIKFENVSPAL